MNLGGTDSWLRIVFIVMLVSTLLLRTGNLWRWITRRRTPDSGKLAIALRSELAALQDLYETNLRFIAEEAGYVLSAKSMAAVYRANLSRLSLLEAAAIPLVVTVYARNERIEALLAIRASARPAQRGVPASVGASRAVLQQEYRAGCAAIAAALTALTAPKEEAAPSDHAASDVSVQDAATRGA